MKSFIYIMWMYAFVLGQTKIAGTIVTESGEPIPFVNVFLKGTLTGGVTADDGSFVFVTKRNGVQTLVAQFIGFKPYERVLDLNSKIDIQIVLKEDITRNDVVNVTASAYIADNESKAVVARPIEVVTTPGAAADINRFYQTMPGVTAVDEGAGLFVRGGHVSETKMMIDGATIIHPYRYETPSGGFFGTISPFLTDGSAFFTGGLSAQYGNVLSGIVDMKSFGMSQKDSYTFGAGLAAVSAQVKKVIIPEKLSVAFSGNYSDTEALMSLNKNRNEFTTFPLSYDLNFNANLMVSATAKLKVFAFKEHNEVGGATLQPDKEYFASNATNGLYNIAYSDVYFKDVLFKTNLAYTGYKNAVNLGEGSVSQEDKSVQFKVHSEIPIGEISTLFVGSEMHRMGYFLEGDFYRDSVTHSTQTEPYKLDYKNTYIGSYLEFKYPFTKRFALKVGGRVEYETKNKDLSVDPRISIGYQLTENARLAFAYGVYHQLPELTYYINNSGLQLTRSEGVNVSYDYDMADKFKFRGEVYYKDYSNLVKHSGTDAERQFKNTGYGRSYGADVLFKHKGEDFEYWVSYSFLDAKRKELYLGKFTSPDYDITHNYTFVYKKSFFNVFNASIKQMYRTGRPYSNSAEFLNDSRLPSYHKTDLSLSYTMSLFRNDFTVFYISVSNLYGKENILKRNYNRDYTDFVDQKSNFLRSVYFGFSTSF